MEIRIRRDGVKEVKVDNKIYEVPHQHGLCPSAAFADAYRRSFFVSPTFMSVGGSDITHRNACVLLAAAHDLEAIRSRIGDFAPHLDQAIDDILAWVPKFVPPYDARAILEYIEMRFPPRIVPSEGPEFEDAVWYANAIRHGSAEDFERAQAEALGIMPFEVQKKSEDYLDVGDWCECENR
jgi:hypothetical protein